MKQRIYLLYNPHSGTLLSLQSTATQAHLASLVKTNPCVDLRIHPFSTGEKIELAATLAREKPDAVWVAGGDGTVMSVARIAAPLKIPIGVLPGGTMNLLARDLGMQMDLESAMAQLHHSKPATIDVAELNGRLFLCLSNIGVSTQLTQRRERLRRRPGWIRWPILGSRMILDLFFYPTMTVTLNVDHRTLTLKTRSITISNNPLDSDSVLIPERTCINRGELGVYVGRDASMWSLPRLALGLVLGNWHGDEDMISYHAQTVRIVCRRRRWIKVMCDGELFKVASPLVYGIRHRALNVLVPTPESQPVRLRRAQTKTAMQKECGYFNS